MSVIGLENKTILVRLSLYADFLYPLAEDSTLEAFYQEKPEGEFCQELTEARERVWKVLRLYRMKLLRLAPAKFIHFGTTREILELMSGGVDEYRELGWSRLIGSSIKDSDTAGYNSVLSSRADISKDCYLEVSYVHGEAKVGEHCVLSYIDIHDEVIPDNVVIQVREDLPVTCSVMLSDAMSETSRRAFLPWKRSRRQQR